MSCGYGIRIKTVEFIDPVTGLKSHKPVRTVTERQVQVYAMCNTIAPNIDDAYMSRFIKVTCAKDLSTEAVKNVSRRAARQAYAEEKRKQYGPLYHSVQYIAAYIHAAINVRAINKVSEDVGHILLTQLIDRMRDHGVKKVGNPRSYIRVIQHSTELCITRVILQAYFVEGGRFYQEPFNPIHLLELQKMLHITLIELYIGVSLYHQQWFEEMEMGVGRFLINQFTPLTW